MKQYRNNPKLIQELAGDSEHKHGVWLQRHNLSRPLASIFVNMVLHRSRPISCSVFLCGSSNVHQDTTAETHIILSRVHVQRKLRNDHLPFHIHAYKDLYTLCVCMRADELGAVLL